MTVGQLLKWQWQGYARYHQNRANLLLHIVAVPLFGSTAPNTQASR